MKEAKKTDNLLTETKNNNEDHTKIVKLVNETLEQLNYDKKTILFPNKELLNKYTTIYNHYI